MRCMALLALGACSFAPGSYIAGSDAGGDDAAIDGVQSDGATDGPVDGSPDAPVSLLRVRQIDIVDAMVAGGPHVDFPLLVSLDETWLQSTGNGGDVANTSGVDIFFSSDVAGVTRLAHEVEVYSPTDGILVAWVKIAALSAQTTLYLHYGNPAITTSQENPASVWSGGYSLVVHFDGTGDATGLNGSTGSQNVGAASKFGPAGAFNGSDSRSTHEPNADNIFTSGGTVDAWVFADTYGESSRGRIVDKTSATGWALFVDNQNVTNSFSFTHDATGASSLGAWAGPDNSMPTGAWHHIAVTYDKDSTNNDPVALVDGAAVTLSQQFTPSGSMATDASSPVVIGGNVGDSRAFDGTIDEVRLSTTPRSTTWLQTQFRNMNAPAAFYTVSAPL